KTAGVNPAARVIAWRAACLCRPEPASIGLRAGFAGLDLGQFRLQRLAQPLLDGRRELAALGQRFGELDGLPVRLDPDRAVRTPGEVDLDRPGLLDDQFAADVVEDQLQQFFAGHGASPPSKCGARASRIRSRARCRRLFTAGTDSPSMSAMSAFGNPSTSARTYTSRNGSGRVLIAFSMTSACSAASTGSSGETAHRLTGPVVTAPGR